MVNQNAKGKMEVYHIHRSVMQACATDTVRILHQYSSRSGTSATMESVVFGI